MCLFSVASLANAGRHGHVLGLLAQALLTASLRGPVVVTCNADGDRAFHGHVDRQLLAVGVLATLADVSDGRYVPIIEYYRFGRISVLAIRRVFVGFVRVTAKDCVRELLPDLSAAFRAFAFRKVRIAANDSLRPEADERALGVKWALLPWSSGPWGSAVAQYSARPVCDPTKRSDRAYRSGDKGTRGLSANCALLDIFFRNGSGCVKLGGCSSGCECWVSGRRVCPVRFR